MKSLIKICNLNNNEDVNNIMEAISSNDGIIACEVSIAKQELSIVYDHRTLSLDDIINSIEIKGYSVL